MRITKETTTVIIITITITTTVQSEFFRLLPDVTELPQTLPEPCKAQQSSQSIVLLLLCTGGYRQLSAALVICPAIWLTKLITSLSAYLCSNFIQDFCIYLVLFRQSQFLVFRLNVGPSSIEVMSPSSDKPPTSYWLPPATSARQINYLLVDAYIPQYAAYTKWLATLKSPCELCKRNCFECRQAWGSHASRQRSACSLSYCQLESSSTAAPTVWPRSIQ